MPGQNTSTRRRQQQLYICVGCGIEAPKSGNNQKRCPPCAEKHGAAYQKARFSLSLGTERQCAECSAEFKIRAANQTRCNKCRDAEVERQKRQPLCKSCSDPFDRRSQRQVYCNPCGLARVRELRRESYTRLKGTDEFRAKRNRRAAIRGSRKYRTDPTFNINIRMRTGISASLGTMKKGRRWEALVGYTVADLMLHLERQFPKGMTWDNRDLWHIDHVLPLASFHFETPDGPEFRAAWALSNLRPIWSADNLKKSAKRTHLI